MDVLWREVIFSLSLSVLDGVPLCCRIWEVVLCNSCGSTGVHVSCGGLRRAQTEWNCPVCATMLSESAQRAAAEARHKRKMYEIETIGSSDEFEEEASSSKRPRSSRTPTQRDFGPFTKMRDSNEDEDVDVVSLCEGDAEVTLGRPSSSSFFSESRGNPTDATSPDEEVFVLRGIRGDVVIADWIAEGRTLCDALVELRSYAEALPTKLASAHFDEDSFLSMLNELSSESYVLTKEHLQRFVACTFTYDQMRLLRKVFEYCFIIHAFKSKIQKYQRRHRMEPFRSRRRYSNRKPSIVKKSKALQKSLINLLTQAKGARLLQGNTTWASSLTPFQLNEVR